jgi:hypothetical protein
VDENNERQRDCPRCSALTRYERREEPWKSAGAVIRIGLLIPCLWPVSIPLWLLFAGVASLRPLRCNVCGRPSWDWRGEPGYYPDVAHPDADAVLPPCDTIRLVRRATVGSETELMGPITRIVRAVQAEGPRFRLCGRSPAMRIHRLRTGVLSNVWRFVAVSEIQWNFGRESRDPTHRVVFCNTAADAPVNLRVRWVQTGAESTRPGLDLTLQVPVLPEAVGGDRSARLDRLFTRLVTILRPDYGFTELATSEGSATEPPAPTAGWLTYLTGKASLGVPSPAVATRLAGGVKIALRPGPAPANAAEVGESLAAVQQFIAADPP